MHGHFGNVKLKLVTLALLLFISSVSVTLCVCVSRRIYTHSLESVTIFRTLILCTFYDGLLACALAWQREVSFYVWNVVCRLRISSISCVSLPPRRLTCVPPLVTFTFPPVYARCWSCSYRPYCGEKYFAFIVWSKRAYVITKYRTQLFFLTYRKYASPVITIVHCNNDFSTPSPSLPFPSQGGGRGGAPRAPPRARSLHSM